MKNAEGKLELVGTKRGSPLDLCVEFCQGVEHCDMIEMHMVEGYESNEVDLWDISDNNVLITQNPGDEETSQTTVKMRQFWQLLCTDTEKFFPTSDKIKLQCVALSSNTAHYLVPITDREIRRNEKIGYLWESIMMHVK